MLIRGLQNPFVTRSMSFQHEDVERNLYLVFVLSDPCSFLFIFFFFQVASRLADVPAEFIRSILCFVLILVFELLRCQMLIPYLF